MSRPVHVVGAGGIGVALAWCLMRDGRAVTMVDSNQGKVRDGERHGLTVQGRGALFPRFEHFRDWSPPANALVLLCTKTYDNPEVLARLHADAMLVPVQNGFDLQLEERAHAGEGIASFVSECERDRPVTRITRPGELHLGARRTMTDDEQAQLAALAQSLRKGALFQVALVNDVRPFKATKLMYNAAISPLAAAAGVDNGELLTDPLAKRLFFGFLQENYAILRHARMPLARIGPFHPRTVSRILCTPALPALLAMFFRPSLRGTYCSMAPDITTGRTEVAAYNGHLIHLAEQFPCPFNRAACTMIHQIVTHQQPPSREHLCDFALALPESVR